MAAEIEVANVLKTMNNDRVGGGEEGGEGLMIARGVSHSAASLNSIGDTRGILNPEAFRGT